MQNDSLAASLAKLFNAERVGRREVLLQPASKMLKTILTIMNDNRYIGAFEEQPDDCGGRLRVFLLGSINRCGVIKPRFATKNTEYQKWEKRYLPASNFGLLVVSTPRGIMTHVQAKEKKLGGRLLAYCY